MRRTRIVCTIGPSSSTPTVLKAMVVAGMDAARFNFSHGDADSHRRNAALVRGAASATGRTVALIGDLQGPKIRTGPLDSALVRLTRGQKVALVTERTGSNQLEITVSHRELVEALKPRDRVLVDDGQIELKVSSTNGTRAECVVTRGGLLGERKGISVPGRPLSMPAITDKDRDDIRLAVELRLDYLALSFVRHPGDVMQCRAALDELNSRMPVIAKLEKFESIRNAEAIMKVADGVMVARGDLGVELKLGEVPAVQKDVIYRANRAGVPVITATEMLESMVTSNRPTRAEASDVANAIWDGTDAVMLSQETSVGAHPVDSVRAMARICNAAERHPIFLRQRPIWAEPGEVGSAIAHAAAASADELGARAIIAFTESGTTALRCSKAHPKVLVIAASPHAEVLRKTCLYSGVTPLLVSPGNDTDAMIANATQAAAKSGLVRRGDRVVVVAGVPVGQPGQTNLLKIEIV